MLGCVFLHVMGLGGGCVATSTSVVQVSGRGSSVDFTIDDSAPFKEITKGLRDYLVRNRGPGMKTVYYKFVGADALKFYEDRKGRTSSIWES